MLQIQQAAHPFSMLIVKNQKRGLYAFPMTESKHKVLFYLTPLRVPSSYHPTKCVSTKWSILSIPFCVQNPRITTYK